DDPLSMVGISAGSEVRLEHRGLSFLDLQEERIAVRVAQKQRDIAMSPNATHPDDFLGQIDNVVAVEQHLSIIWQRCLVSPQQRIQPERAFLIIQMHYQGRDVYDGALTIDVPGELRKHVCIRLPVRLLKLAIDEWAACAPDTFEQALR